MIRHSIPADVSCVPHGQTGQKKRDAHLGLGRVTEAPPDLERLISAGRAHAGAIRRHCQVQRARRMAAHLPDLHVQRSANFEVITSMWTEM